MQESWAPLREATQEPENEPGSEEATSNLGAAKETPVDAKHKFYTNLAGELKGNQVEAPSTAEGDVSNLASKVLVSINEDKPQITAYKETINMEDSLKCKTNLEELSPFGVSNEMTSSKEVSWEDSNVSGGKQAKNMEGSSGCNLTSGELSTSSTSSEASLKKEDNSEYSDNSGGSSEDRPLTKKQRRIQRAALVPRVSKEERRNRKKEKAAAKHARQKARGDIVLSKKQKSILNKQLRSVGINPNRVGRGTNKKMQQLKMEIAAGNLNILNSDVLKKLSQKVQRKATRTATNLEAANSPETKTLSKDNKCISTIHRGYQSRVPNSEATASSTQTKSSGKNDLPATQVSENDNVSSANVWHSKPFPHTAKSRSPPTVHFQQVRGRSPPSVHFQQFRDSRPPHMRGQQFRDSRPPHMRGQQFRDSRPPHMRGQQFRDRSPPHMRGQQFRDRSPPHMRGQQFRDGAPPDMQGQQFRDTIPPSVHGQQPWCRDPPSVHGQQPWDSSPRNMHGQQPWDSSPRNMQGQPSGSMRQPFWDYSRHRFP